MTVATVLPPRASSTTLAVAFQSMAGSVIVPSTSSVKVPPVALPTVTSYVGSTKVAPESATAMVSPAPLIVKVPGAGATARVTTHGPPPVTEAETPANALSAPSTTPAAAFQAMGAEVSAPTVSVNVPPVALAALTVKMRGSAGATDAGTTTGGVPSKSVA